MKINRAADYQGLFGCISDGTIKDLGMENVDLDISRKGGGLVGRLVTSSYDDGFTIISGTSIVKNCYVTGSVKGDSFIGGIAGYISDGSTVSECYTTANVSGSTEIGGIAGYLDGGTVSDCYSTGDVHGTENISGIVGYSNSIGAMHYSTYSMVKNCYATGNITGSGYIGGVVGYILGEVQGCVALNPAITGNTYDYGGRIISSVATEGYMYSVLNNNYALDTMTVNGVAITDDADKGLTHKNGADMSGTEALTAAFWTNELPFDTDIWDINDGAYPKLLNCFQCNFSISPSSMAFTLSGGSRSVTITANESSCTWTAVESLDWITLSKTSGTGSDSLYITAAEYTGEARIGTISIAVHNFTILQNEKGSILFLTLPTILSKVSPP